MHPNQTPSIPPDPFAATRLSRAARDRQLLRQHRRSFQPRLPRLNCSCLSLLPLIGLAALFLLIYLIFPRRTNVLLLGIDYTPPGSTAGRSDTIMLTTFVPIEPYVGMLSIPRDLMVLVPGVGQNRINTAHFFAEAQQPGSGPTAVMKTIQLNFNVEMEYYVRIRFEGVKDVVNAMGGVDVVLPEPMAGYEAGRYHLTGNKALAFARHRYGEDDFFRMEHGQLLLKSAFKQMLNPLKWWRIPGILLALSRSIDTNLPPWAWPRLALALARVGPGGIDNRTITRQMATPFITDEGADVLNPDWGQIQALVKAVFGE